MWSSRLHLAILQIHFARPACKRFTPQAQTIRESTTGLIFWFSMGEGVIDSTPKIERCLGNNSNVLKEFQLFIKNNFNYKSCFRDSLHAWAVQNQQKLLSLCKTIPLSLAASALTSVLFAQSKLLLPQPVPFPKPIADPKDTSYKGVIKLQVDATDVLHRIYKIRETIPVDKPGRQTFLFPQWTPGDHAPNEPLEKLAGLIFTVNGNRLHWVRDTVDVHAFSVDVPFGVKTLEVEYQYLGATSAATGPVLITPTMLDLQWQSLILYPAGHFMRDIVYQPTVTLPATWTYLTSLDAGKEDIESDSNTFLFPPVALDALIDQPIMAGQHVKQIILSESPVPVRLDIAAENPDDFALLPDAAKQFATLMTQTYKLFSSHHYDHYDHMLFLSDELTTYFEHHRSGENTAPRDYLKLTNASSATTPDLSFVAHGYVHSWNGMYRRPAEMWTPNLNTPERDSMLWVFEGLTSYWADVLCARAGIYTHDDTEQHFAGLAAAMTLDAGADWRSLEDANNDPIILGRKPASWPSWQRNMFDPYASGEMIWLEADTIIRQESSGKKSLDDFARTFFGGDDAGDVTRTYTFDQLVTALNAVQTYDWLRFFRAHLDDYGRGKLVHSIDRSGYELVFTDKPVGNAPPSESLDLAYSLGMRVTSTGFIYAVHWDGPAYRANLTIGETIVSVNGDPYDPQKFVETIDDAAKGKAISLTVKRGGWEQTTAIAWQGGMQYPHLQRIAGQPAVLDDILRAK